MRIGLVSRTDRNDSIELTKEIISLLSDYKIFIDPLLKPYVDIPIIESVDVIIAVGGDGTILRTCKQYGDIPILAVNMGTYGFMCELNSGNISEIPALLKDNDIDRRSKLAVFYHGELLGHVLNEVVVRSTSPIKMDHLTISIDEETYEVYGDGVIVATPNGSTAYSLSAGGSIIHPKADVLIVTPICPLFREAHPYIAPDDCEVVVLNSGKECYIILDGQPISMLHNGEHISVTKSSETARFIRRKKK